MHFRMLQINSGKKNRETPKFDNLPTEIFSKSLNMRGVIKVNETLADLCIFRQN